MLGVDILDVLFVSHTRNKKCVKFCLQGPFGPPGDPGPLVPGDPRSGPAVDPPLFGGSGWVAGWAVSPPFVVEDLACRDALVGGMSWRLGPYIFWL